MKFDVCIYSNSGGRPYNEDRAEGWTDGSGGLFVVADGLGGHRDGDKAAVGVIEAMRSAWDAYRASPVQQDWLPGAVAKANETVLNIQRETGGRMKSTLAALSVEDTKAQWAHVGDSRLYFLTGGRIYQLTEDHSVTYKKFRAGEISRMQINFDEDRPSLLRAVGDVNHCVPDVAGSDVPLCPGDAFMLCSDGFWEYLYEEEILVDSLKAETAQEWMEQMLLRIMERVRPDTDNLTAMTIFLR
jgi:serine/threonine protein phosphatase PrpC